ncbi:MAG: response regulator [Candidatus Kapaibacterium sp.]
MLVDDDELSSSILQEALILNDHECDTYLDVYEALENYTNDIELIITDYRMPKLNGIELMKKIREKNSEAKIIITSGAGDMNIRKMTMLEGATAFIGKPFNFIQIMEEIESFENIV